MQEPANNPAPLGEALPDLDLEFLRRVYRTSLGVTGLVALLSWARFGAPAALGWVTGAGIGLLVLVSVEWSVRRFVRPESGSTRGLLGVSLAKMVVITLVLVLAFLAALRGRLSLLWMLGGFSLPGAVVLLKLIGQKLLRASGSDRRV